MKSIFRIVCRRGAKERIRGGAKFNLEKKVGTKNVGRRRGDIKKPDKEGK